MYNVKAQAEVHKYTQTHTHIQRIKNEPALGASIFCVKSKGVGSAKFYEIVLNKGIPRNWFYVGEGRGGG